jgi:hypothetical protein
VLFLENIKKLILFDVFILDGISTTKPCKMYAQMCDSKAKKGGRGPVKPFCKVCFDTGKSEKEYTSHFVRVSADPSSKVCCPTLLDIECQFCHLKGHTVSKCLRRMKLEKPRLVRQTAEVYLPQKVVKNPFEFLDDSDDSDVEDDISTVAITVATDCAPAFSYRDALIQPVSVSDSDCAGSISTSNSVRAFMKYSRPGSWADDSDSDEE